MTTAEAIELIKEQSFEFVWWGKSVQKTLDDKTIVGINGRASSYVRMGDAIERLRQLIVKHDLPLKIRVHNENINQFQLIEK